MNDLAVLQDCCADLGRKINAKYRRVPFSEQLLSGVSATNSSNYCLSRSIGAEIFILKCNKVNICKFYFVLDSIRIFISEQDARHAYVKL